MQVPDVRERRGQWAALVALMLAYAALFALAYPPLSGIEDEVGYVNQTLVWSRGAISLEGAGLSPELPDFVVARGRHVAVRNPGRSLLALPFFALGGARLVYVSGLVLHLAATALAAFLLERLGRSPLWAALVLFHPTLAIYSRTMMGDEAAGTGLLLAALAVGSASALAGAWAGLAVGLAATMRYHAGLALPIVAVAFCLTPGRARPWRDAALCLLAGGGAGGLIVAYNRALYDRWFEAASSSHGLFGPAYLAPQATFYATALALIWPAMLLAPWLDRSRLRWLVRGVCGFFFVFFSCYYFHDSTDRWIETIVIGQRLLQVALPIWIVSYAGVVDDRVAAPLCRWAGARAWAGLTALGCIGLLGGTALIFNRHQDHLNHLRAVRDAAIGVIPDGALVVFHGPILKLFGIPSGLPSYRWRLLQYRDVVLDHTAELEREERPWYLAALADRPGEPLTDSVRALIAKYRMEPVPTPHPLLRVFVAWPRGHR
jgi:hypothetical protein